MNTLYLIPTPLGKQKKNTSLPEHTLNVVRGLRQFIVENIRTSQSFLQWIDHPLKPFEPEFRVLNRKTPDHEIFSFLKLLQNGDAGLMSEAGAPGVADPGAKLVRMAHDAGHRVVPLTGPSSIILALMASGLNGQQFTFHGYLPVDTGPRKNALRGLEQQALKNHSTEIFMEAPFRNNSMMESILEVCRAETRLCIACNITMPDEWIRTKSVARWSETTLPDLDGRPALFLLQNESGSY